MKVVDCHTHIFPDAVAERALEKLSDSSETRPFIGGKASDLIESMKIAGVCKSVIAPIATKPAQVESITNYVNSQDKNYFIPLGSIHPDYTDIEREADRLLELKIPGIKLHSNYQEFFPQEERMFPIYKAMEERGLVVLFHGGKDISFEEVMAPPEGMAIVADKFPKLKIIAAHLGGWMEWKNVEKYLIGKNVWFDTSYTIPDISKEEFTRLVKKHGADRIVFGTDSPWRPQKEEIELIDSLDLTSLEKEKIFWLNAKELFPDFID